jgi:hypothetical protein
VDSGEMPIEYEFNKYDAKEFNILRMDPKNLVNFWDKDTFTKEDYYNKYLRYRRSEDTIIIKEIL